MATTDELDDDLPDDPPRSPPIYKPCSHYTERVECDRRPITPERAEEAIRKGRVEPNPADRPNSWRFMLEKDGCDIVVAVGEDRADYIDDLIRITAYVDVVDYDEAVASDEWTRDEVHVAALLQYLVGCLDQTEFHPKKIDVDTPVPYHGHKIIFKNGYMRAYCLACEMKTGHKAALAGESCRR